MRFLLPAFCALVLAGAATAAFAAPKTIDDCESIQAPDAYNQCLASFGPVAHEHMTTPEPPATAAKAQTAPARKAVRTAARRSRGHSRTYAHRGHQRVRFSVVPGRSRVQ